MVKRPVVRRVQHLLSCQLRSRAVAGVFTSQSTQVLQCIGNANGFGVEASSALNLREVHVIKSSPTVWTCITQPNLAHRKSSTYASHRFKVMPECLVESLYSDLYQMFV